MRRNRSVLLLLGACTAAGLASAQAPQAAPPPPAAGTSSEGRERVSDAHLGLEVQARLNQNLGVSNLSSIVRDGVVTLDGMVRADADLKRAEELALEVPGIHSVVNELSVTQPLSIAIADEAAAVREREDTGIETEVAARLNADPVLGSRGISVVSDELTNTVTLTGAVTTEEEKARAGLIAVEAYPGGQVRNQLEVRQRL
jgi:osmotically-inducible protein OsmY